MPTVELSLSGGAPSPEPVQEMRPALITSGIVHVVILLLIIFGLPLMPEKKLDLPEPIAVTMVAPASDQARTTKIDNPTPKPDQTPPVETAPEPPKPPPPPAPTPPEPPAEKLPELKPMDQQIAPVPTPEALPELAKPMQIIKPQPVAPPKPVTPAPPKKVQADQQQFDALLANLAPPVPKTDPQSKDKTPQKQASNQPAQRSPLGDRLTADELGRVREQLKGCWNVPIGAMNAEELQIHIVGEFNPDRTLRGETLVDTDDRYNKDPYYRAAADSAMRALRNPRCNPLDLPPNKYDEWRSLQIDFDPKEMLNP